MGNKKELLTKMEPQHAYEVAELQYKYINSSLNDLGRRMCHVFYENATKNKYMFGYVYLIDSKVVGFAINTTDTTKIFNFKTKLHIILSLLIRPHVIKKILSHRNYVSKVNKEALYSSAEEHKTKGIALALFSAVEEKYRPKGIARKIYKASFDEYRERGIKYIESNVDADNKPALTMAKFTGWKVKEEFHLNGKQKYRLYFTFE